ncbi:MAG: ParB/Srx family N-terminal domain-containing protein, partial [Pseudomonadota bacterium]
MLTNEPIPHIEQVRVDGLKPYPKRARKHPTRKLQMLIASVRDVGLINPIITDGDGTILSGHLRVEAFHTLGLEHIPAVRAAHLTKSQKAAFVLAANRLPETGTWDQSILKLEFELLIDAGGTLDLSTTGFEIGEIDL